MTPPPTGTVTFLFTDIEGSTRLAQQHPAAWTAAKARHHAIVRGAIESHGGYVFQVIGDAFCAAFDTAPDALTAALDAQRALHAEPWDEAVVRVRIGIHAGAATILSDGDYEGYLTLARVQRIMSAAYGGQVLMSQEVADLVTHELPAGVTLRNLGAHRLKDLVVTEQLHQLVAADLRTEFPALKTADHPNNLPTQLTSFIGREAEVADVRRLLSAARLLTLTGAGGVGKTRLALQVATEDLAAFADGVWFVELAPLSDPALIASTIAAAIGIREEPNRPLLATLGDYFRAKSALILLDNCEHLISAAAQACDALLRAAPHLKIIATSREALAIGGETEYRVPSLDIPSATLPIDALAHVASVALFAERAKSARSGFALTAANAPAVVQICRRLDGIPLALELAAARVKSMPVELIAEHLDDRFRLLTGGSRTALPRQQTLRALIDWSYALLSDDEGVLLRRLSVFASGLTPAAAEVVCGDQSPVSSSQRSEIREQMSEAVQQETANRSRSLDTSHRRLDPASVLDVLTHLVDKSLVVMETTEEAVRYRMLETVRYYALEKLTEAGEGDQIAARHRDWFLRLADSFEVEARAKKPTSEWMRRLGPELDNLRAALAWCQHETGGAAKGLRMSTALGEFWRQQNALTEGREWLRKFLTVSPSAAGDLARARALHQAGYLAHTQGDDAEAIICYEQSLGIEGQDLADLSQTRLDLGESFYRRGDFVSASEQFQHAVQLGETTHDAVRVALAQMWLGIIYHEYGDLDRAVASHRRSLETFRVANQQNYVAAALANLARAYYQRTDYPQAIDHYLQVVPLFEQLRNRYNLCIVYNNLSLIYIDLANYVEAIAYLTKCLDIAESLQNDLRRASALGDLATCQLGLGDPARALEYVTHALDYVKRIRAPQQEGDLLRIRGEIRAALGMSAEAQQDFEKALGLLAPLNQKSRLARLFRSYGELLLAEPQKWAQGIKHLERALEIFKALGSTKEVEKTRARLGDTADPASNLNSEKEP